MFDPHLPLDCASTIPSSWYTDPRFYQRERERVFPFTWQAVGRLDQLPRTGSYFTRDVAGEPIVVLRDGARINAFSNVCRHRAARLVKGEGEVRKLRCPYHGWTYDLEGNLRGCPEFDGVKNFDRDANGLASLEVDTFGPLIFVSQHPPLASLRAYLEPLRQLPAVKYERSSEYELACNWKVFVDNYLDGGYHVNSIHPALADVIDYKNYRTDVHRYGSVQTSPLKSGGVSAVRRGAAQYWWFFPNFMINVCDDVMDTNLVLPLGVDRCRVIMDFYFGEGKEDAFKEESLKVAHQVQLEDVAICEDVQKGLSSSSYNTGRFSVKREAGGYHFHQLLAAMLQV
jgi:choline monooxygenase